MASRIRPYTYYDVCISLCSTCLRKVEGKIVFQDGRVLLRKHCPEHGSQAVLIADDVEYWRRAREAYVKPAEMPQRFQTPVRYGCPYDCGLCADHEQHACLSVIELTDHCNLACPVCYAESGPTRPGFRSLAQVERMLDAAVAAEGEPDVVQLSGGEPTLHPELLRILAAAKARPIRHLMINTNGIRIANEEGFAETLAQFAPNFEVYLQFDSFEREALLDLRGADLREVRQRAVERLNAVGLSTTLVVTVKRGANDHELGRIVDWALEQPAVRGVTFQPVQVAGRTEGFAPARDRLTLSEVRRRIAEQTAVFASEDLLPVPCHPDCIAMAYALKTADGPQAVTGLVDPQLLIERGRDTIAYEHDHELRRALFDALSLGHGVEAVPDRLRELLCCLPRVEVPGAFGYADVFRVIILQFLDAHSFDVRSVKKACVQVVHPEDGRLIPMDTYNLFYRDELESELRARLAGEIHA